MNDYAVLERRTQNMSNKKEKVEFVREEAFEAVEDELSLALNALEASNARILELLNSESRGDLPFLNMPPDSPEPANASETAAEVPAPEASAPEAAPMPKATPRVRKARKATAEAEA